MIYYTLIKNSDFRRGHTSLGRYLITALWGRTITTTRIRNTIFTYTRITVTSWIGTFS